MQLDRKYTNEELISLFQMGYKILGMKYARAIGHLAGELDCFYKEIELGIKKKEKIIILCNKNEIANVHLLEYFKDKELLVIGDVDSAQRAEAIARSNNLIINIESYFMNDDGVASAYSINKLWTPRQPLLKISEADVSYGKEILRKLGINEGDWYVTLHTRNNFGRPQDIHHGFRNSNPIDYDLAINEITNKGGKVIRIGDSLKQDLPKNLIDYPNSIYRSDRMDLFLCATSKFLIGTNSGLYFLAALFGTPLCLANVAPLTVPSSYPNSVNLFKKIRNKKTNTFLNYVEAIKTPISAANFFKFHNWADFEIVDNNPSEIRDLILDMFDYLHGMSDCLLRNIRLRDFFCELYNTSDYCFNVHSFFSLRNYENLLKK